MTCERPLARAAQQHPITAPCSACSKETSPERGIRGHHPSDATGGGRPVVHTQANDPAMIPIGLLDGAVGLEQLLTRRIGVQR